MELTKLAGIGEARTKAFEELGIFSCEDLINFFPYKYYDFSKTEAYADDGRIKLIKATVVENAKIVSIRKNFVMVTCKMTDEIGHKFNAIWYNQQYVKSGLFLGAELYIFGKNSPTKKNNFVVLISKFCDKIKHLGLLPVYKTAGKIGQTIMQKVMEQSLQMLNFSSFIPNNLLQKYNLINLSEAYSEVHNPTNFEITEKAKSRISLEDLIPHIATGEYNKSSERQIKLQKYNNSITILDEYKNMLPFSLTLDQTKALFEIEKDMSSKFAMNRLLQGDVGSGKTAVAFAAAFLAAKNNYQAAIIAPTEILAVQHYEKAKQLFKNNNFEIVLLTGSTTKLEKYEILQKIKSGESKIIIGTHSLLSDEVEFNSLSFITIDEQHRFGVEQRKKLKNKGFTPDVLVMSATPIPRSLSLVIYGDLDITTISSRPKTLNITTNLVNSSKFDDMWNFIDNKINTGSKVYVVCAKIDEELDDESDQVFSANSMYKFLSAKFGDSVGLLHGKLAKSTQNTIIDNFKTGKIKMLVSTTVVEVGVDIPDADIIVIATPERFGLATLHQLRGRVGRQGQQSFCFCMATNLNEKSYERLKFFRDNTDGFKIAEFDLQTRGGGSIMGTNQHGKNIGFSFNSKDYSLAKELLEQIKPNVSLYAKILEKGNDLYSASVLSKIVLN